MNGELPRSDEVVSAADVQAPLDCSYVRVPNRFVFGFGMDVAGVWRNLPSIRALRETQD